MSRQPDEAPTNWLAHVPAAAFASVMGLAGLALALAAAETAWSWPPIASRAALAVALLAFAALAGLLVAKARSAPAALAAEWQHPVRIAFFPAISISLLLVGTALLPALPALGAALWLAGTVGQGALTLAVVARWIGRSPFQPMHLSPAWFLPAVGNVIVPQAGVPLGYVETSWLFFSAGTLFWLVLLTLVMNRLIFHDPLPARLQPTLAILVAPPALAFLAWTALNGGTLDAFARILFGLAVVFLAVVLTQAQAFRTLPFAISWWALSFPAAALTVATFRYAALSGSAAHDAAAALCLAATAGIVGLLLIRSGLALRDGTLFGPE